MTELMTIAELRAQKVRKKRDHNFTRNWSLEAKLAYSSEPGPGGCLLWTGSVNEKGYGLIKWRGKTVSTHRLVWIDANGQPPAETPHVLHRCDVRRCINLAHLWVGTNADNMADMVQKRRHVKAAPKGAAHGSAKLATDEQALSIFHSPGKQTDIAARYGVNCSTVSKIKRKETWRHIHETG